MRPFEIPIESRVRSIVSYLEMNMMDEASNLIDTLTPRQISELSLYLFDLNLDLYNRLNLITSYESNEVMIGFQNELDNIEEEIAFENEYDLDEDNLNEGAETDIEFDYGANLEEFDHMVEEIEDLDIQLIDLTADDIPLIDLTKEDDDDDLIDEQKTEYDVSVEFDFSSDIIKKILEE